MQKTTTGFLGAAIGSLVAGTAVAGGFSLYTEGSTVAIGNYAAGISAEVPDASTAWYNPAGLVLLDSSEMVFSGAGVFPKVKLTGDTTFSSEGVPPYQQSFTNMHGEKYGFVPAFYYSMPVGANAAFGLVVNAPFGLATSYEPWQPVRYAATTTELLSFNVAPVIAGRLTENFSVGAGLDLIWLKVRFNNVLGSPAQLQYLADFGAPYTPGTFDTLLVNRGHSFAVGFHAGVLGNFNENHTRVGVNFQSGTRHTFRGFSRLTGPLADADFPESMNIAATMQNNFLFSGPENMPAVTTLSAYQDLTDRLALLGSAVYTGWGVFRSITLNNIMAYSSELGEHVNVMSAVPQNYRDAWRMSLGLNYRLNERMLLRAGGGWDQSPVNNVDRDVRLPDNDRGAISVGAHFDAYPSISVDIGYTHLFAKKASLNKTLPLGTDSSFNVRADARNRAEIVGLQAVWKIDQELDKDASIK